MKKIAGLCALIIAVTLSFSPAAPRTGSDYLKKITAQTLTRRAASALAATLNEPLSGTSCRAFYRGPEQWEPVLMPLVVPPGQSVREPAACRIDIHVHDYETRIDVELRHVAAGAAPEATIIRRSADVPGLWSLLPPLTALLLAFILQRFLLSLLGGIVLGAMLLGETLNPLTGLWLACRNYMAAAFVQEFSIYIFLFIVCLIGMVQVMTQSGGVQGLVDAVSRIVRGPRSAQLATFFMGLVVFFDDYTNAMVVGNTMRPLCDRWRVSREKLAYIVDSTAAPIAGLAVVSTWIGFEVGLLQTLADDLQLGMSGYEIFFHLVPLRFYCLLTLLVLALALLLGRDLGPMVAAQKRAARNGIPMTSTADTGAGPPVAGRWENGVVPLVVLLASIPLLFLVVSIGAGHIQLQHFNPFVLGFWRSAFVKCGPDAIKILTLSASIGLVTAIALPVAQKQLTLAKAFLAAFSIGKIMYYAVCILILAWAMRDLCNSLGTSLYLCSLVSTILNPQLLPMGTFMVAAVVSFATGSSWGTLGIVLPTVVPVAFQLGDLNLTFLCLAAILDGSIFGDHCSPISDTTILSALSSGCKCLDHVKTQLPYGLLAAALAIGAHLAAAFLPLPLALIYLLAGTGAAAVLLIAGRRPS